VDAPDLVVVGGGVAGLAAALAAAEQERFAHVVVLSKGELSASNSYAAQGGIAAAVGSDDDPALHAVDTLESGRGLCRPAAVEALTREAAAQIAWLRQLGARFDDHLGREGGHSRRRIVHAGGVETGKHIADVLAARVREHAGIEVREHERVLSLARAGERCAGVLTRHGLIGSRATLLATGGYAALWRRTTNPAGAVGDGLLLALRTGARLADLELVQFHPTALLDDGFLLSEALRGEGALLLDVDGARFTDELAPRDVVARAIAARERASLDLRPIDRRRYPGLIAMLERAGYDPSVEPVPVAPAAHYSIGGIVTDLDGRTTLPGLYAAGECACSGVHGANRLASNSLLECLVFGRRAALAALAEPAVAVADVETQVAVDSHVSSATRRNLWDAAGVSRSAHELAALAGDAHPLARLIGASALLRTESRGVHFRTDRPVLDETFDQVHTIVEQDRDPGLERWS
jgi:L-aspartate oxidase